MRREVLLVAHTGREPARRATERVAARLSDAGVGVRLLSEAVAPLSVAGSRQVTPGPAAAEGCEIVVVVGGDGTLLRGAEAARPAGVPVIGINLGHVGFLAEAEVEQLDATLDRVLERDYVVDERMTLDVAVTVEGRVTARSFALNEVALEKSDRSRMLECVVEVDARPVSRWGCDGVLVATPTGSTAYAFSAGGPIVWPDVQAMLLVPISAHALFARPMVTSPESVLAVEVLPGTTQAVLSCDGRRRTDVPPGGRVQVVRGAQPVLLARLADAPFADRLVKKFELPVHGWRGH